MRNLVAPYGPARAGLEQSPALVKLRVQPRRARVTIRKHRPDGAKIQTDRALRRRRRRIQIAAQRGASRFRHRDFAKSPCSGIAVRQSAARWRRVFYEPATRCNAIPLPRTTARLPWKRTMRVAALASMTVALSPCERPAGRAGGRVERRVQPARSAFTAGSSRPPVRGATPRTLAEPGQFAK